MDNGDYVKFVKGKFKREIGLIVRIEETIVLLLSDLTSYEK